MFAFQKRLANVYEVYSDYQELFGEDGQVIKFEHRTRPITSIKDGETLMNKVFSLVFCLIIDFLS